MTDDLDEATVAALCRDGRADVRSLAEETDAVATTVQKRLRVLEDDGVIRGYTARIDYERLGYETAVFRLSVDERSVDDVTARLRERNELVTVYETTGRHGVFAVGTFEDETAVGACLRELHAADDIRALEVDVVTSVGREGDSPLVGG